MCDKTVKIMKTEHLSLNSQQTLTIGRIPLSHFSTNRAACLLSPWLPTGVSTGQVSLVRLNEPADEETGPAQPGHRGGAECELVSLQHARHRPQETGERVFSQPRHPPARPIIKQRVDWELQLVRALSRPLCCTHSCEAYAAYLVMLLKLHWINLLCSVQRKSLWIIWTCKQQVFSRSLCPGHSLKKRKKSVAC